MRIFPGMPKLTPPAGAVALLAVLVAAGCGGGSDDADKSDATQVRGGTGASSSTGTTPKEGKAYPGAPAPGQKRAKPSAPPLGEDSAAKAQSKCRERKSSIAQAQLRLNRAALELRPNSAAGAARAVDQMIAVTRARLNDVKGLDFPSSERAQVQKLLRSYAGQLTILGRMRTALRQRSLGQIQELSRQSYAQRISNATIARSLGAPDCGLAY